MCCSTMWPRSLGYFDTFWYLNIQNIVGKEFGVLFRIFGILLSEYCRIEVWGNWYFDEYLITLVWNIAWYHLDLDPPFNFTCTFDFFIVRFNFDGVFKCLLFCFSPSSLFPPKNNFDHAMFRFLGWRARNQEPWLRNWPTSRTGRSFKLNRF